MGRAFENGMTLIHRGLELLQCHGDESLGDRGQVGWPPGCIERPCVAEQALDDLRRPNCVVVVWRVGRPLRWLRRLWIWVVDVGTDAAPQLGAAGLVQWLRADFGPAMAAVDQAAPIPHVERSASPE